MLAVVSHKLAASRNAWWTMLLSTFLLPVGFLVGIGLSVGTYVNQQGRLDIPYLDFIGPGVLASTVLQVVVGETTWPIMAAFVWNRTYDAMRASPLTPGDILRGEIAWVLLRVGVSATGFLVIMALFGTVHSWWGLAAVPASMLLGLAAGLPVLAFSASVRSDSYFAMLFRFVVIPMTLFAGVFFPVAAMPLAARLVAYVSPLWHAVELCRAASLGLAPPWGVGAHVACLAAWAVGGYFLAAWRYGKRMAN